MASALERWSSAAPGGAACVAVGASAGRSRIPQRAGAARRRADGPRAWNAAQRADRAGWPAITRTTFGVAEVVAPRIAATIRAARCLLPLGIGRQSLAGPGGVCSSVLIGEVHDGMI